MDALYVIQWAVAVIFASGNWAGEFTLQKPPMTLEACTAYIEKYKDRMPDYVRGHFDADFDTEVLVRGNCKVADGKDASRSP